MDYLQGNVPSLTPTTLQTSNKQSDFQDYLSHASYLSTLYSIAMRSKAFVMAVVNEISTTSPSLTSLALLLIVLFLSLRILGMLWRAFIFWVNLAIKTVFGLGLAFIAVWIFTRGPDGFAEDVQDVASYWLKEYKRYSGTADTLQQWGNKAQNFYQQSQRPTKARKRGW